VVEADTVNTFKNRLDKHWYNQDVLFNFNADLIGTGSIPICMWSNVCKMRAKRTTCARLNALDWIGYRHRIKQRIYVLHTFTYSKWFCSRVWPVLDKHADNKDRQGRPSTMPLLDELSSMHSLSSVLQTDTLNFPTSWFPSEHVTNDSSNRTGCKSSATAITVHNSSHSEWIM